MKRPKIFIVDASCDVESGMAGVAVLRRDRDMVLLTADVVRARDSNEAELHGVTRALYLAAKQGTPTTVWCDSRAVVAAVNGEPTSSELPRGATWPKGHQALIARARKALENPIFKVESRGRDDTHPAHVSSRQVMKAWLAGRRNEPTWD